MQIQDNKKIHIPAVAFLMAVMVFALSPMSPAMVQESSGAGEDSSSDRSHDGEKSYEGKDGKSCGDKKNKDKSESTRTSGNQA